MLAYLESFWEGYVAGVLFSSLVVPGPLQFHFTVQRAEPVTFLGIKQLIYQKSQSGDKHGPFIKNLTR